MDRDQRAVILVSGGLNSCVASCIREGYETAFLHVRYPHRAADRELECFQRLAAHLNVKHTLVADLPHLSRVGGNARVDRHIPIEDAAVLGDKPASTYVPGLLPAALLMAFNWADALGATQIVIGACENLGPPAPPTRTLYPDHRREVFQLLDELMALLRPAAPPIRVAAPLIDLSRSDVIRLGRRFESPFELTWSCYRSDTTPCEQCYGCVTRMRGFLEAGLPDPIFTTQG